MVLQKPAVAREKLKTGDFSSLIASAQEEETDIEDYIFLDEDIEEAGLYGLGFTRCVFERCRLTAADAEKSSFVDVVFESCDLSNGDFSESYWRKCALTGCRMTGARFPSATMRHVRLTGCGSDYTSFDRAVFDHVEAADCDFHAAYLRGCKCKLFAVNRCRFVETNFHQTSLAGIDFTTSELSAWVLSESNAELRGAIVSPIQAVALAGRLGLTVKYD